jgi:DNA N-6-adenine-methyltransferase Dam
MNVHFSSQKMDWQTPDATYKELDEEFHFDHDPCPPNHTVDGLQSEWGQSNFVNPPYGRELPLWIAKSYEQWQLGKTVVFLIPSRTDTRWWHDYCMKATEIRFIKRRLKFKGAQYNAPFPSAIVIFKCAGEIYNEIALKQSKPTYNLDYIASCKGCGMAKHVNADGYCGRCIKSSGGKEMKNGLENWMPTTLGGYKHYQNYWLRGLKNQ